MRKPSGGDEALFRLRAVLCLRRDSMGAISRRLGVTPQHLRYVLIANRKPSRALLEKLVAEIGVAAWAFVFGRTNVLDVEAFGPALDDEVAS